MGKICTLKSERDGDLDWVDIMIFIKLLIERSFTGMIINRFKHSKSYTP